MRVCCLKAGPEARWLFSCLPIHALNKNALTLILWGPPRLPRGKPNQRSESPCHLFSSSLAKSVDPGCDGTFW